jgi:hypothetical protein
MGIRRAGQRTREGAGMKKALSYMNQFGSYAVRLGTNGARPMPILASLIEPIASIIDKVIPDKAARDKAKLDLLALQGTQEMQQIQTQLSAIVAEANSRDPWTSRARPSFLYVMYVMILWALPMGVLAAFRPDTARDIAAGMNAYLAGLPEPLYALFGTGYLGYTAMRQWGKVKGVE